MQLNGLELLGAGVVYVITSGLTKKYYLKKRSSNTMKIAIAKACKIFTIEEYQTMKKQMTKVEKALSDLGDVYVANYTEMLREKLGNDEADFLDRDVHHYSMLMFYVLDKMKLRIKERIIDNHILEKDDIDFRLYTDHANRNLVSIVVGLMDREYISKQFYVCRAEVHDYNTKKLDGDIYPILNTMWWEIRTIAERAVEDVRKIEEE